MYFKSTPPRGIQQMLILSLAILFCAAPLSAQEAEAEGGITQNGRQDVPQQPGQFQARGDGQAGVDFPAAGCGQIGRAHV